MSGADLSDALSDMWRSVLLFVPTALAFLAILLIGYVLARLVRTVVVKTLSRIGFDRAVERGAIGRALGGRVEPSDLCAKIAFYAVLLFALQLAFGIWGPNAVSDLLTALIGWLPRAFVAIVIIVVAAAIGGAVRDLIGSALGGLAYGRVLAQAAYWLIVALGVIAALDQVQIATAVTQPVLIAVLATVAGVLIVGVGGGLIRPMQQRWEIWLERASTESAAIREHARSYADERARAAAAKRAAEEEAARTAAALAAEQARLAERARIDEQARIDEAERQARAAAAAEAERVEAERAESARVEAVAEEEAERRRAAEAAGERTQVIPMQRPWPGSDDRSHVVPGFDDPVPVETEETTTWLHLDAAADPRPGDSSTDGGPVDGREADGGGSDDSLGTVVGGSGDGSGSGGGHDDLSGSGSGREADGPATDVRGSATASDAGARVGDGSATASSASDGPDDRGVGERPGESTDTVGAEAPADRSGGAPGAISEDGPEPQARDARSADDDAETTADVTGQRGGTALADADGDSTVAVSRSELRQALPPQSDPADGERTQVIRARRDDGPDI